MSDYKCRFKDHWSEYTDKEYDIIRKEREENKKNFKHESNCEYGYVCRACSKPNRHGATNCTRCYFSQDEWDIQKLPSNIFLDIIEGREKGTSILYRDDLVLLFDDKFAVSKNHIDVIPIQVICDITELNSSHIGLLERMHEQGIEEFKRRKLTLYDGYDFDEIMSCGFNFPVSVKHLHLHLMLPPYSHRNSFKTSRWHSYKKCISDLKLHGKIRLYKDYPNDEEVTEEHNRAYKWHDFFEKKI